MLGERRLGLSRPVLLAASAAVLTLADGSAWGTTYTPTNIGALLATGSGATTSMPTALNDSDQVVGYYFTTTGATNQPALPFVYTPSNNKAVTVPNVGQGYTSQGTGINDAGLVVGFDGLNQNAFTYNANTGAFTSIPQGSANYAIKFFGVNASGVAAGELQSLSPTNPQGIVYDTSTNTLTNVGSGFSGTVSASNLVSNVANAINDAGVVTGSGPDQFSGVNNVVPYIATPKVGGGGYNYTDLSAAIASADGTFSLPNSSFTGSGTAIDALGNVAGTYNLGRNTGGAFLYTKATGSAVTLTAANTLPGFGTGYLFAITGLADVNGVPVAVGTATNVNTGLPVAAFEYVNGNIVSLAAAVPGTTLVRASAVNGNGDVVAVGSGGTYNQAYVLQATLDTWNNAGGTGDGATWDTTQQNWHNNSSGVSTFSSANADNVLFSDANNGHYAVTLNSTVTPFAITFNNSNGNYVVSGTGTIGGGGGFVKTGTGSVTLNVAAAYTGPTAVNQGKLTVNGSTAAVSAVTVASGATLSGTGTVAGTVAVAGTITGGSGATASDTAGKLTTGAEAWSTGGAYVAKYDGTRADQLVMSGLTAASGFIVDFQAATPGAVPAGTYVLAIDQGSTTAGAFSLSSLTTEVNGSTALPSGYSFQDVASGGYDDLDVVVASAPEPTSLALLVSVASPALLARRRRGLGRAAHG